jgi:hypothetical protein
MPHPRTHRDPYFHLHPMHSVFSLIASLLLAGMVILMFTVSAR